ncbi:hypothetical protein Syun_002885 [Stephania yunnanensis]|uniref:Uncharacterized protein n=1 Tax=Stephania yunnanensis TaxID=152371 RepID=A0AAP0L062_9MAGN
MGIILKANSFSNLSRLEELDMPFNGFVGPLPSLKASCMTIAQIHLSFNEFNGPIPSSYANNRLPSLIELTLSNNQLNGSIQSPLSSVCLLYKRYKWGNTPCLVGEIPLELTSLTFLSVLNVSRNHLIGMIPSGRQFDTFPSSSFEGNSRLCGIQLQINCNPNKSGNVAPPSDHANQSNGTNFDWIFAVAGYGSGLVVGLVIEHFVLWRNKYYLEKFMNTIRFFQGKRPLRLGSYAWLQLLRKQLLVADEYFIPISFFGEKKSFLIWAARTTTTTATTPMVRKVEETTQPVIGQEEVKLLEIVIGIEDEHEKGLMVERYLNDQLGLFFVDDVGGELDAPFLMV